MTDWGQPFQPLKRSTLEKMVVSLQSSSLEVCYYFPFPLALVHVRAPERRYVVGRDSGRDLLTFKSLINCDLVYTYVVLRYYYAFPNVTVATTHMRHILV